MRVVFAGTPPFAVRALAALHGAGHDLPLVLTRPDRPSGRGLKLSASAVAEWASSHGLEVHKPSALNDAASIAAIRAAGADIMVVAAYGLILPPAALSIAPQGCLNIHASLLPRWRGAAPIQRALLAGDFETGICIMRMDAGLDTGPVLLERRVAVGDRETSATLTETLSTLGAGAIVEALERLASLVAQAQDPSAATYATKIAKSEARIDWAQTNSSIDRQVRAFDPSPGAETTLRGQVLKIWQARPAQGRGRPGQFLHLGDGRLVVACGAGALELLTVQRAGGKRLPAGDFFRGAALDYACTLGEKPLASA